MKTNLFSSCVWLFKKSCSYACLLMFAFSLCTTWYKHKTLLLRSLTFAVHKTCAFNQMTKLSDIYSFQVGSGYSDKELKSICDQLNPHWKKFQGPTSSIMFTDGCKVRNDHLYGKFTIYDFLNSESQNIEYFNFL